MPQRPLCHLLGFSDLSPGHPHGAGDGHALAQRDRVAHRQISGLTPVRGVLPGRQHRCRHSKTPRVPAHIEKWLYHRDFDDFQTSRRRSERRTLFVATRAAGAWWIERSRLRGISRAIRNRRPGRTRAKLLYASLTALGRPVKDGPSWSSSRRRGAHRLPRFGWLSRRTATVGDAQTDGQRVLTPDARYRVGARVISGSLSGSSGRMPWARTSSAVQSAAWSLRRELRV